MSLTASTNGHAIEVLRAELVALKELMNERNDRYEERHSNNKENVKAAFDAAEKAVAAALTAQKEAVTKAEEAQRTYNQSHNDLLRKMEDMVPRTEFLSAFQRQDEKLDDAKTDLAKAIEDLKRDVAGLRESRSQGSGKDEARAASHLDVKWVIALAVTLSGVAAAVVSLALRLFGK